MNYLELIVGFHKWKETNPLPASAIALWYELVSTCNKAGWPSEFTLPNGVLQANAGLSRKEFDRARQLLIEYGLIQYKKSHRVNNAGKYKIISRLFERDNGRDIERGNGRDIERGNGRDIERGNLNKNINLNLNTNENISPATAYAGDPNPFRMFEAEGFGTISSVIAERIGAMIDEYGERWVCEAMRAAVVAGKRNLSYVEGILKRYKAEGVDEPWLVKKTRYSRNSLRRKAKPEIPEYNSDSALSEQEKAELDRILKSLESGGAHHADPL